jgi:hypothetical protein
MQELPKFEGCKLLDRLSEENEKERYKDLLL